MQKFPCYACVNDDELNPTTSPGSCTHQYIIVHDVSPSRPHNTPSKHLSRSRRLPFQFKAWSASVHRQNQAHRIFTKYACFVKIQAQSTQSWQVDLHFSQLFTKREKHVSVKSKCVTIFFRNSCYKPSIFRPGLNGHRLGICTIRFGPDSAGQRHLYWGGLWEQIHITNYWSLYLVSA